MPGGYIGVPFRCQLLPGQCASYLEPFEFGEEHKLSGSALLNPKDIKLNKYGNLPRNKLSQLKAKIGDVGGVNAVWQRKKPKTKKGKRE